MRTGEFLIEARIDAQRWMPGLMPAGCGRAETRQATNFPT
jgi:hypothetical protein